MYVEIIRRPEGEAPDWVRDGWIGLRLPLSENQPVTVETVGSVSGPRSRLGLLFAGLTGRTVKTTGYIVWSKTSIEILAADNIKAAEWWVHNAPDLLQPEMTFMFNENVCGDVTIG